MDEEQRRKATLGSLLEGLGDTTRLRSVGNDPEENRLWIDRDIASMVEGCFDVVVDPRTLTEHERASWTTRLRRSWMPPSIDPGESFLRRWWIMDEGRIAGTLAVAKSTLGRALLPLFSLYMEPWARSRGVAARALSIAQDAAVVSGLRGIQLDVYWTWPKPVRFYLRCGFWVRMWKRALTLQRGPHLPPHDIVFNEDESRFTIVRDGRAIELIEARRRGERLGWKVTPAYDALRRHPDDFVLASESEATFALALAVEGFPLVRSERARRRSRRECDVGGPESLARKIEIFEAIARRNGHVVRTPRIPGLRYRDLDAID